MGLRKTSVFRSGPSENETIHEPNGNEKELVQRHEKSLVGVSREPSKSREPSALFHPKNIQEPFRTMAVLAGREPRATTLGGLEKSGLIFGDVE